jgi:IS5 family transposase
MEEALYEIVPMRQFARLPLTGALPDENTVLNFRCLLEAHAPALKLLEAVNAHLSEKGMLLRRGTIVDATIIAALSSTKNEDKSLDPEMRQIKKANQWHFGMKAHIGVDGDSGLVRTVVTTAANAGDITQLEHLPHGDEKTGHAEAGYIGAEKRLPESAPQREWHIAEKRGQVKAMEEGPLKEVTQELETFKAHYRARVEHPFRVVKCQFGFKKVRFDGLAKNTAQVITMFALSNLWLARRRILAMTG